MKRIAPLICLALALVGGWWLRASDTRELDSAGAYRLRLAELTLAGNRAPVRDRFLAHPDGATVPWPALPHAALAASARLALVQPGANPALADVDESRLAELAGRLGPWLGALVVLLAFTSLWRLPGGTPWSAALAAGLYAFTPQIADLEGSARVDPQALVTGLGLLQLGSLSAALRGRELSDVTLAALLGGLCCGLALLADTAAILFLVAAVGTLAWQGLQREGEGRLNAWRAALLFAATALTVTILPSTEDGPRWAALTPLLAGQSMVTGWSWAWLAWGAFPLAWLALLRRPREPERVFLAGLGAVALVAGTLDVRFASVFFVALVPTLALAVADLVRRGRRGAAVFALLWIAPAFAPLALDAPPLGAPGARDAEHPTPFVRGLRWMREHSPSPGPFNQPDARQDWCILTAPASGGAVAYHTRRPVVAAGFDGVTDEPGRTAVRALLAATPEEFVRALSRLGARYVVVSPAMLRDPAILEQGARSRGALHHLALPPENAAADHYAGLELVYASSRWIEPGGPALSIYRRVEQARVPVPQMRPRK